MIICVLCLKVVPKKLKNLIIYLQKNRKNDYCCCYRKSMSIITNSSMLKNYSNGLWNHLSKFPKSSSNELFLALFYSSYFIVQNTDLLLTYIQEICSSWSYALTGFFVLAFDTDECIRLIESTYYIHLKILCSHQKNCH